MGAYMVQRNSMSTTNNMELENNLQLDKHAVEWCHKEKEQDHYEHGKKHVER